MNQRGYVQMFLFIGFLMVAIVGFTLVGINLVMKNPASLSLSTLDNTQKKDTAEAKPTPAPTAGNLALFIPTPVPTNAAVVPNDTVGMPLPAVRDNLASDPITNTKVNYVECSKDSECIIVKADACGCSGGGTATTVNSSHKDLWLNRFSTARSCVAVMSEDWTCKNPVPRCINKSCVLTQPQQSL